MSRIEKTISTENPSTKERLRDEFVQDAGTKNPKGHPRLNCFFILLALFVSCVLWIAWMISSTGLFYIPLLSSVAFHKPEPVRAVSSGTAVEILAETTFKSVLLQRLQSGGGKLLDRKIEFSIPESSLTSSLRKSLETSVFDIIDPTSAQVAILPDQQFEIFIPLKNGTQKTAAIARVSIAANRGVMSVTLKEVRVGSFRIPIAFAGSLVDSYVNAQLESVNKTLGSYMEVDTLTYKQGSVLLSGIFTVQLK